MKRSEDIGELATALALAQGEIEGAEKSSTNPHFKSKYADLAACWDACRGPLSKNKLSIIQSPSTTENGNLKLTSLLLHSSGQWIEDELILTPRDASPQSFGSATTYARRYSLMAIVGIAPDDDDGNAASMPARKDVHAPPPSSPSPIRVREPDPKGPATAGSAAGSVQGTPDFAHATGARKAGEGERAHITRLAEANGWTTEQVKKEMVIRFGVVSKVSDLFMPQYQELAALLSQPPQASSIGPLMANGSVSGRESQ